MLSYDPRLLIAGALSAIALIGAFILAALEVDPTHVAAAFTASGTFGGFIVGLYSDPRTNTNE